MVDNTKKVCYTIQATGKKQVCLWLGKIENLRNMKGQNDEIQDNSQTFTGGLCPEKLLGGRLL